MPECEIFGFSWFFHHKACLGRWLWAKVQTNFYFGGARHHLISCAHAEHTRKEMMRMLTHCSGYASVPYAFSQSMHQFLTRTLRVRFSSCSWRVYSACFKGNFSNFRCALSVRVSSWRVCSVHDTYARRTHQFLIRTLTYTSVPDTYSMYAQCMHQLLTRMLITINVGAYA